MDLNTILIILGIIALIGLVGHGIWSNRREKSLYFDMVVRYKIQFKCKLELTS